MHAAVSSKGVEMLQGDKGFASTLSILAVSADFIHDLVAKQEMSLSWSHYWTWGSSIFILSKEKKSSEILGTYALLEEMSASSPTDANNPISCHLASAVARPTATTAS